MERKGEEKVGKCVICGGAGGNHSAQPQRDDWEGNSLCVRCRLLLISVTACKKEVVEQLEKLKGQVEQYKRLMRRLREAAKDFNAEVLHFRVVKDLEDFYRFLLGNTPTPTPDRGLESRVVTGEQEAPVKEEGDADLHPDDRDSFSCGEVGEELEETKEEPKEDDDSNDADFVPEDVNDDVPFQLKVPGPQVPAKPFVNFYRKHKAEINRTLEGMAPFKYKILRPVLIKMKRQEAEGSTQDKTTINSKYHLKYDATSDQLSVQGIAIQIKEEEKLLVCSACGYSASGPRKNSSKGTVENHLVDHILGEHLSAFQCPHCSKSFPKRSTLREHVRELHIRGPVECPVCGKTLKLARHLDQHLRTHQSAEEKVPKPRKLFTCPTCFKEMTSSSALKLHQDTHNPQREVRICSDCGKSFTRSGYPSHRRICQDVRKETGYPCHLCKKVLRNKVQLTVHLRRCHYQVPGEKQWQCSQCPKMYRSKGDLLVHERGHSLSEQFSCSKGCGARFSRRYRWKKHEELCQGQGIRNATKEPGACPICGKSVKDKRRMTLHIRAKHDREPTTLLCSHCPKTFKSQSLLSEHLRQVEGERSLLCRKGCGAGFTTSGVRRGHEKACQGRGTAHGKRPTYVAPPVHRD